MLRPVFVCPDPIRGGDDVLVMSEVLLTDLTPHPTNTRAACAAAAEKYADQEPWFGIEQEYTFLKNGHPLGWPQGGYPGPQGPYYCGVGADEIWGRDIVEAHTTACIDAGLAHLRHQRRGDDGPVGVPDRPDRPAADRRPACGSPAGCSTASPRTSTSPSPSTPSRSPATGTAPAPTPTSRPRRCARATTPSSRRARPSARTPRSTSSNYGAGVERRLTGLHETAPWTEFSYGVSNRGASVRIPWQVEKDGKGYLEDRRPNANCDPYVVTRLIVDTCCGALAE